MHLQQESTFVPCAGYSSEIADSIEPSALRGCAAMLCDFAPSNGVGVSEPFRRFLFRPMPGTPGRTFSHNFPTYDGDNIGTLSSSDKYIDIHDDDPLASE